MNSFIMNGEGDIRGDARRYLFALELKAGSRTEYTWSPATALEGVKNLPEMHDTEILRHTLLLRRGIVGATAKENEGNVVNIEVTDPDMPEKISFPLCHLTKGKESQAVLDVTFPELAELEVTFTLAEGSGPVHILGYHFIERIAGDYQSEAEEEEVDEDEENEAENVAEVVEKVKAVMRAKRRMATENGNTNGEGTPKKKVKAENGAQDEDMEKEPVEASADASN